MEIVSKKSNYDIKVKFTKSLKEIIDSSINSLSSSVTLYKCNKKILDIQNKNDSDMIESLSITKSFCAFAIIFLIQDKFIKDCDDYISKYINSWSYGRKKDIKIKHILTHTSGLDNYWNYDEFMEINKINSPNIKDISLTIDKIKNNEVEWYYNNTAVQIIPYLIKKITGYQISEYLKIKLFNPLNIEIKWNKDKYGNDYGPNGLCISSDSLCKVGILIINDGIWEDNLIIRSDLIDEMIKPRIDQKDMRLCPLMSDTHFTNYCYLWYRYNDLIVAEGYLGQQLVIDKKNNLVGTRLIEFKDNIYFKEQIKKDRIYFDNFINLISRI